MHPITIYHSILTPQSYLQSCLPPSVLWIWHSTKEMEVRLIKNTKFDWCVQPTLAIIHNLKHIFTSTNIFNSSVTYDIYNNDNYTNKVKNLWLISNSSFYMQQINLTPQVAFPRVVWYWHSTMWWKWGSFNWILLVCSYMIWKNNQISSSLLKSLLLSQIKTSNYYHQMHNNRPTKN